MTPKKQTPAKKKTTQKKSKPTGDRRTQAQRLDDQTRIAELHLKGMSQIAIAKQLKMTEATVSRDMAAIRLRWQESPLLDYNEAVQRELEALNIIQVEAWAAWEASKEEETIKSQSGGEGLQARATITKRSRVGDDKYLKIALECIDKRAKLLGLYKQTIEHTGKDGQPIKVSATIDTMKDLFQMMRSRERNGSAQN